MVRQVYSNDDPWPTAEAVTQWNCHQAMPLCCPVHTVPTTPLEGLAGQPGAWQCPHCGYVTPILVHQARAALAAGVASVGDGTAVVPLDVEMATCPRAYLGIPLTDRGDNPEDSRVRTIGLDPVAGAASLGTALATFIVGSLMMPTMFSAVLAAACGIAVYVIFGRRTPSLPGSLSTTTAELIRPGVYLLKTRTNRLWSGAGEAAYAVKVASVWAEYPDAVAIVCDGSPNSERLQRTEPVTVITPPAE